jgi:transposase
MKILSLDLGKFNSVCCFFDSKTRKPKFITTPTKREHIDSIFKDAKSDLVVMEACGPSGWINDLAQEHGLKTLVCSTNEEAWRWANVKRKTDRDDALKLARMAAMGELKGVHTPSLKHREFRSLVKYRKTLDGRINKTKNAIRAWFVNHGIEIATGEKAWHTGREHINSFRKPLAECGPEELWKGELDIELTILDSLTEQLSGVVKKLEAIGKNDERVKRIQTIPGVGPRTAEILVACLDDPHRFENGRQVSAYFGLVPRQYQSGETDRNGRITKRGNPLARTILVECAWASLRYNPWAKGVYERICGKQKTRKKKAAIALARKLAVIAWAMLRDEKDWDPKQMIRVTESFGRMSPALKESLQNMKPKENADQRKCRLRKEARAAKEAAESRASKTNKQAPAKRTSTSTTSKRKPSNSPATRSPRSTFQPHEKRQTKTSKPRRAGKPVRRA